jgi:hypothetical protein
MTVSGFFILLFLFICYYLFGMIFRDRSYEDKGLSEEEILKDFWYHISPFFYAIPAILKILLILFLIVTGLFLLGMGGDRPPSRPSSGSTKPKLGYDADDEIFYEVQRRINRGGTWMTTTGGSSDESWSMDRCDELADANQNDSYRVIATNRGTGKKIGVVYVR